MVKDRWMIAAASNALLLTSCGRPDSSGIYLHATDREVALVQLVQTKDGAVTGRLEDVTVGQNGVVNDQASALDGAASKHDLMLKPANAWLGGITATGSFSNDKLTLVGKDFTLEAQRATLDKFQAAVARLRTMAADDRGRIAAAQAAEAAQAQAAREAAATQAAQTQATQDTANKTTAIQNATMRLRNETAKINAGIANSPTFAERAAANTARIAQMVRVAPTLSDVARNQLETTARQVEVGTNQIEVARSQYVIELAQVARDAASIADPVQRFCSSPQGSQFAQACAPARAAIADLQASLIRGRGKLLGDKQAVHDELARQSAMIERMGG